MTGNLIKDKSSSELLSAGVFDKQESNKNILSPDTEKAINDKVEESYQGFLDHIWDGDNADLSKDFNDWLDKKVDRILERSKIKEIESVNSDIEDNLVGLNFEIELSTLQDEINNNENIDRKDVTVDDLAGLRVFGVGKIQVAAEVNKIKDNDKFKEVSDLLKEGNTKELQLNMVNLLDPRSDGDKWTQLTRNDDKNSNKVLGKYGVDDKFGTNTFAGLEKYVIELNNIESVNTNDSSESNENSDGSSSTESNTGSSAVNASASERYEDSAGVETGVDNEGNGVEVLDTGDVHVTMEKGGEEVLMTDLAAEDKLSTRPPNMVGELKIKDGELIYTGTKSGQETMTVIVKAANNTEKYNRVVTFDVKGETVDGGVDVNGRGGEFEAFMKEIENKGISERLDMINNKVLEKEQIILDLNKKNFLNNEEKKQKINAIKFIEKLHRENELLNIKEQFGKGDKTELIKKMQENATIYIEGKYVKAEDFIKKLDKHPELADDIHIVGLNIELTKNYRSHLNNKSSKLYNVNTKYKLTKIVISDDENYGNSHDLTNIEQIQYKADAMIDMEKKIESSKAISERRALKRILGIKGLFGRGGVDEDMSIATLDYETNNSVFKERKNLRKLKKVLMRFLKDDDISVKDAFEKVHKAYEEGSTVWGDDKNLNKLLDLYTLYKGNANGVIGGGDYFQKAMGLLDNYFIRGIAEFNEIDDGGLFNSLYHNENIGRMDGYIDPDKKRKAIKAIFKGKFDGPDNVDLLGVSFENSKELKDLKKIVKHVDIGDYLVNGVDVDDKWSRKFDALYNRYMNGFDDVVFSTTDGMTGKAVNYYNAVFDLLVGIGEGRQSMVEAVNSLKIANSTKNIKLEDNDKNYYSTKDEKQFVMMLADFNSDARADHGDRGVRMGLEIKNVYKNVKVDQMNLSPSDSVAWKNLVEFTKLQMRKNGEEHLLSDLETKGGTISDLVNECNKNPGLLNYMQNVLANSPMPVEDIFRYGGDAAEKYLDSGDGELLSRVLDGTIEIKGAEELLDQQIQNLVAQGLKVDNIPELRTVLKPSFYGGLIQNGGNMIKSVGFGLSLNTENAGTFSMNLGYTDVPGDNGGPAVGIVMAWNNTTKLGDKTSLSYGESIGATAGSLFIPIMSVHVGVNQTINENNICKKLDAKSLKKFHIGVNGTMIGALPTWGVAAGVSQDKLAGINIQYENIKNSLSGTDGILYKILIDPRFGTQNEIALIKNLLLENFPKSDEKDRDVAANNIARGLSYYNLTDNLDSSDPRVTTIVHDMAENYALQWKNAAMDDADGNIYLESVGVGVQFLAGYYPVPVLYASVAWSKNTYSVETKESYADYLSHLTTGNSMERIDDVDEFYSENGITDKAVDYLNAKMSIAHPDIDVSRLDMQISVANASNGGGQAKSLYIPQNLYRYVNINIDSNLAHYTNICDGSDIAGHAVNDKNQYIEVPLNTQIALLSSSKTNTGRFNLIIGDTKAELDDVIVDGNMEDYDGNPADFEGMNEIFMTKEDINTKLEGLNNITLSTGQTTFEIINQPLKTCESVIGGSVIFDLLDGEDYIDMGGANSVLNIANGKLTMPQFGTLTMYYNADGKYEMYYSSNPSDKLDISFDVEGTSWTSQETVDFNVSNVDMFADISSDIDGLFDNGVEQTLRDIDINKITILDKFLSYASKDIDSDDDEIDIGEEEYNKAKKELLILLGIDFTNITTYLENVDNSIEKKSLIINRMKGIMAFESDVGTANGLKHQIENVRKKVYEKLSGSSRAAVGSRLNKYREDLLGDLYKEGGNLSRDVEDNLFGYTAFYRKGTGKGRNFSMTAPGDTKVLGNKMLDVTDASSKEWFMENFKLNKVTQRVVLDVMKEQMRKSNSNLDETFVNELTVDDLIKLMESEGESVDIGGKNVKLDLNYYFYLLGECGNESIGVKIDKIVVEEGGSDSGGAKISVDPQSAGYIYVDGVESRNENRHAKKGSVGVGLVGGKAKEITPPDPTDGTGTVPDPNEGTGSQNGTGGGG